eukprot:TRINITY_DN6772_c0_g1_i1.p1 TRINITY_DN6772_c0_g1~~TRINITY_DN6772_c0_g1_i1.p1  ORF type:complete len:115 (+),score=0.95 TRINITY_DN6772_c0_g1_i1:272-616(+)
MKIEWFYSLVVFSIYWITLINADCCETPVLCYDDTFFVAYRCTSKLVEEFCITCEKTLGDGAIALIVIGALATCLFCVCLCFLAMRRRKSSQETILYQGYMPVQPNQQQPQQFY